MLWAYFCPIKREATMKRSYKITALALLGVLFTLSVSFMPAKDEWIILLDKDHSQWETYLSYRHSVSYHGELPVDASGKPIAPLGYNVDPDHVFSINMENNEPILRISGDVYGCIFTKSEFENYHLRLKVRWGQHKSIPRIDKLKDSGIVYHSIGKSGVDYWRAWMLGQEFQVMEGHIGDYWNISTSAIEIRAFIPEGEMNSVASAKQPFLPFGSGQPEGFCLRSEDHESEEGEWTTIDLICYEDKSLHIVNGQVVMVLRNSAYLKDGKRIPLIRGKIQLQSEAAEVFYKDIKIRKVRSIPDEYADLFVTR
jgi:hypothetical protein